jgi:dTMP kinase
MPISKGVFIVIDGPDGSGKGTQAARLVERLTREGMHVEQLSFPTYGKPEAFFEEEYLRGAYGTAAQVGPKCASLFYALDRFHHAQRIRELLADGVIVVSDRYVSANKGHQTAKITDPAERKAFVEWLNDTEYNIMGIPVPDLTVLLHVPAEIAFDLIAKKDERTYLHGKPRDIHEADINHLKAAELAYLEMPEIDAKERWIKIACVEQGALLSIEEVHERLWNLISQHLA